jgi:hypothetical protein
LPDPEVVVSLTAPVDQPSAPTEAAQPTETALTREEITDLISTARVETRTEIVTELKRDLDAAYKAARRSESKGDIANSKLAKLETRFEELATRGMEAQEARAWKAERALERVQESTQTAEQSQEYERQAAAFQQRSASYLRDEGIKADDPILTSAFAKLAADAKSYDDWDKALIGAVSAVHKGNATKLAAESSKLAADATKLAADSKTVADKAREDERAKLRNEQRAVDGPIDKGQPSSPALSKKTWDMTDEEFKAYDAIKDAERRRRMTQLR